MVFKVGESKFCHCDRWQCLIKFPFSYRWWLWHYFDPAAMSSSGRDTTNSWRHNACVNSRPCGRNHTSKLGILVGVMDGADHILIIGQEQDTIFWLGLDSCCWYCWWWFFSTVLVIAPTPVVNIIQRMEKNRRHEAILRSIIIVNIMFFLFFFPILWLSRERIPGSLFRPLYTMILLVT